MQLEQLSSSIITRRSNLQIVIRVRKLSESGSIYGHYAGKTDLKLDSLSFLTLISKLQWCIPFQGSPWGYSLDWGLSVLSTNTRHNNRRMITKAENNLTVLMQHYLVLQTPTWKMLLINPFTTGNLPQMFFEPTYSQSHFLFGISPKNWNLTHY